MKKLVSLLLAITIAITCSIVKVNGESNIINISTSQQLYDLLTNKDEKNYSNYTVRITNDLDMSNYPIVYHKPRWVDQMVGYDLQSNQEVKRKISNLQVSSLDINLASFASYGVDFHGCNRCKEKNQTYIWSDEISDLEEAKCDLHSDCSMECDECHIFGIEVETNDMYVICASTVKNLSFDNLNLKMVGTDNPKKQCGCYEGRYISSNIDFITADKIEAVALNDVSISTEKEIESIVLVSTWQADVTDVSVSNLNINTDSTEPVRLVEVFNNVSSLNNVRIEKFTLNGDVKYFHMLAYRCESISNLAISDVTLNGTGEYVNTTGLTGKGINSFVRNVNINGTVEGVSTIDLLGNSSLTNYFVRNINVANLAENGKFSGIIGSTYIKEYVEGSNGSIYDKNAEKRFDNVYVDISDPKMRSPFVEYIEIKSTSGNKVTPIGYAGDNMFYTDTNNKFTPDNLLLGDFNAIKYDKMNATEVTQKELKTTAILDKLNSKGNDWIINSKVNGGFPMLKCFLSDDITNDVIGDLNGNQKVDYQDAVIILQHDSGAKRLTEDQIRLADVNEDGQVNYNDAVQILKMDAGISG